MFLWQSNIRKITKDLICLPYECVAQLAVFVRPTLIIFLIISIRFIFVFMFVMFLMLDAFRGGIPSVINSTQRQANDVNTLADPHTHNLSNQTKHLQSMGAHVRTHVHEYDNVNLQTQTDFKTDRHTDR